MKVTVWCNRKLNSSVLKTGTALANMLRFPRARLPCLILESKLLLCGCVPMFLFLQCSPVQTWDNCSWKLLFHGSLALDVSFVAFSSWLWVREGLGIRGVILRSALKTSERMGDLQSPMLIEQYNFRFSSCDGRENRIIWTLQKLFIDFLWVGMCL